MADKPFCPDPLWDSNLTWYTDNPKFTVCFEQGPISLNFLS